MKLLLPAGLQANDLVEYLVVVGGQLGVSDVITLTEELIAVAGLRILDGRFSVSFLYSYGSRVQLVLTFFIGQHQIIVLTYGDLFCGLCVYPVDGTLDLTALETGTALGFGIVGAVQFNNVAFFILYNIVAGQEVCTLETML